METIYKAIEYSLCKDGYDSDILVLVQLFFYLRRIIYKDMDIIILLDIFDFTLSR